ncbi:MAG: LysM peptidoglycan-binding domain-containing protein [Caldilineales bacterium]
MSCNRCGGAVYAGLQICPHCGARQKKRTSHTTCAHCRHRAPSGSSVCPRCGHVLRARRPPTGLMFVVALVALTAVVLTVDMFSGGWRQIQISVEDKVAMAQMQVNDVGGKVLDAASSLAAGEIAEDQATPTPAVVLQELADPAALLALQALPTQPPSVVVAPTTVGDAVGGPPGGSTPESVAVAAVPATATPPPATATAAPTNAPTDTPVPPTATRVPPTATRVPPTATPAPPTATPAPPTATPAPPTATPVPPTATPEVVAAAAGAGEGVYRVQPGDNWFSIARSFGITQEALAAYNNRTPSDILQVDQQLRIPAAGAAIQIPTATAQPTATPRPTATPVPTATAVPTIVRLPAPVPVSPANLDGFNASSQPILTWQPVAGMTEEDYYYVKVAFTMSNGEAGFVDADVAGTSFGIPWWVFDAASPPDRLASWTVQVRRIGSNGQPLEVSPASMARQFYWR